MKKLLLLLTLSLVYSSPLFSQKGNTQATYCKINPIEINQTIQLIEIMNNSNKIGISTNNHKDHLFLLNPNFKDDNKGIKDQVYYCPFNAMLEGVLKYFPHLREELKITYVDFPRPRKQIIEILGE